MNPSISWRRSYTVARQCFAAAAVVVLADWLLWDHPLGCSAAILAAAIALLILWRRPTLGRWMPGRVFAAAVAGMIAALVIEPMPLTIGCAGLLLLSLALYAREMGGEGIALDLRYLADLGPEALPAVRTLARQATDPGLADRASAVARQLERELDQQLAAGEAGRSGGPQSAAVRIDDSGSSVIGRPETPRRHGEKAVHFLLKCSVSP